MFRKRITLFKLFDFKVHIDITWIFIAVLVTWSLSSGIFPYYYKDLSTQTYWIMGIVGALGLFMSIILHELSHSLIARKFGLPIKGITLFIFGGVAEMTDEQESAKAEFFMAIAGPVMSIAIAGVVYGLCFWTTQARLTEAVSCVLRYLWLINFVLAGFNMVPAFPLDGGRVFRSIL